MNRLIPSRGYAALLAFLLTSLLACSARAGSLIPNGDPRGGPASATSMSGLTVDLSPNPAFLVPQGNSSWLDAALAAQGFTTANNWNIIKSTLTGGFRLDQYWAWADKYDNVTQGNLGPFSNDAQGFGGAVLGLTYLPNTEPGAGALDPTGSDVHWIQVVRANDASPEELKFGSADGTYTRFLDNFYDVNGSPNVTQERVNNGTVIPFYDTGYAANSTSFLDIPSSQLFAGLNVGFQAFISTQFDEVVNGTTIHNLTIYDGVSWGFSVNAFPIPEPGSFVMLACGIGFAVVLRRRLDLRVRLAA